MSRIQPDYTVSIVEDLETPLDHLSASVDRQELLGKILAVLEEIRDGARQREERARVEKKLAFGSGGAA